MPPQLAAGAVIFDGARVLLVRRGRAPGRGTWSLPGGRVRALETPGNAIVREVREETGLDVRVGAELGTVALLFGGERFSIHEFLCVRCDPDATPVAADDADEACWASNDDMDRLGVTPEVRAVIARARQMV